MGLLNKIKMAVLGFAAMAVAVTAVLAPLPASAKAVCRSGDKAGQTVDNASECGEGANSADHNLFKTISQIVNVILGVIGLVAVVVVILGGIQFVTSTGDPAKTKKAKDTILYGIIGLVVALLAFAIVNFVLGNVFSNGDSNSSSTTSAIQNNI